MTRGNVMTCAWPHAFSDGRDVMTKLRPSNDTYGSHLCLPRIRRHIKPPPGMGLANHSLPATGATGDIRWTSAKLGASLHRVMRSAVQPSGFGLAVKT
jgi:hypothetical protein